MWKGSENIAAIQISFQKKKIYFKRMQNNGMGMGD